jgi:uncharacterized integral membrane protein
MKKISIMSWIVGIIIVMIIIASFVVMNSRTAHVDLFFIDGDASVCAIIMSSFLLGFFAGIVFIWLRRAKGRQKTSRSSLKRESSLVGEI